jgi:dolichol-phosphate mannosyltransferase
MKSSIIVIFTYNEKENIRTLINAILNLDIDSKIEILVVDDNSPDGTWKIVQNLQKEDRRVQLLRRIEERDRGKAAIAGFKYALGKDVDYIIEMDGDFSHNPEYIPNLLIEIKKCDVAIGSRFISEGVDARRLIRRFITHMAHLYIKLLLRLKVEDPTSGYRCFRKETLRKIDLDSLTTNGPSIIIEMLFKCYQKNLKIHEIPIHFEDRNAGISKLNFTILMRCCYNILKLKYKH